MSKVRQMYQNELEGSMEGTEKGRCLLLDVRERSEFDASHLPFAQFAPLSRIDEWSKELDKEDPLILYCRTQNRSRKGAERLVNLGFQEVCYLEGGYRAWTSHPRPLRF